MNYDSRTPIFEPNTPTEYLDGSTHLNGSITNRDSNNDENISNT